MPTSPALQRIRDALRDDAGLPALGQAVSNVSRMAADQSDTVDRLAQAILSDVSLTQRLLRCANSPLYRTRDAAPVTTVSRALMLLGFDQVRSLALSMMLVDHLLPAGRSIAVLRTFGQALGASSLARATLARRWPACAEEAAISAMFRGIGRLLVAVHAPDAAAGIRDALADGETETMAARRLLGRSLDELTQEVVGGWGLPARLEQSLASVGPQPSAPRGSLDWVRLASAFADEAGSLARRHGAHARERIVATLARRYGDALEMDAEAIHALLAQAHGETVVLAQALGLVEALGDDAGPAHGASQADRPSSASGAGTATGADATAQAAGAPRTSGDAADGAPRAAGPVGDGRALLASLSRISEALAESQGSAKVAQIATDALRETLGARRAIWFARDDAAAAWRPRAASGCELGPLRARVAMPVQFAPTIFHAAIARNADLHIADVSLDTVRHRLPPWLEATFPDARGFLLLPVTIDGRAMGFFYADRDVAGAPAPDGAQLDAIRLLRSQVVLALRTEPATAR